MAAVAAGTVVVGGEGEAADTVAVGAAVVDTVVAGTVAITKIHSVQLRRYSQLVVRA